MAKTTKKKKKSTKKRKSGKLIESGLDLNFTVGEPE